MHAQQVVLRNNSSKSVPLAEIERVAAALHAQVNNEFFDAWGIRAEIIPLARSGTTPDTAWPLMIVDKQSGGGVHFDDVKGRPFARVAFAKDWALTASHELLEMLADPLGATFDYAPSIEPDANGRMVRFLREVCDPCTQFSYPGLNGVLVSDFLLPAYYDAHAPENTQVDFTREVARPYHVPLGGFLSWIDPQDGRWHFRNGKGKFELGPEVDPDVNPRAGKRRKIRARARGRKKK